MINDLNLKEQVGSPADIATENIVLLSPQTSLTLSEASSEQEAVCETQEVKTKLDSRIDDDIPDTVNPPCRYELPPRSKRGVPPKRYDPEFESQRSQYPVSRDMNKLAQIAVAFQTIYTQVPFLAILKKLSKIPNGEKQ